MTTPPYRAGSFTIPPAHPALPGHFPGHPIVPGVVLVDAALALIAAALPGIALPPLTAAKFLAPVGPDQPIEVRHGPPGPNIAFMCLRAGVVVLKGQLG